LCLDNLEMKYRFNSSEDSPEPSNQPNFDDERTVATARPVVPLEKINAKTRHRKQWFLGGAFAIAMMLGAASALLASYFKLRNVQKAPAEVSQEVDVTAAPLVVAENPVPETETPLVEDQGEEVQGKEETEELSATESTPKKHTAAKPRTAAAHKSDDYVIPPNDDRQTSESDQLQRIRDAVLYDEWQERRARRVLRRERRRAERYNHRDLSNLDEIFEGRRRPNP
jgi:hypothetical protein